MSEVLTRISLHRKAGRLIGCIRYLRTVLYGDDTQTVGTGFQSHDIGTAIAAIVAHKLLVDGGISSDIFALDLHAVACSPVKGFPRDVRTLTPATGINNLNFARSIDVGTTAF